MSGTVQEPETVEDKPVKYQMKLTVDVDGDNGNITLDSINGDDTIATNIGDIAGASQPLSQKVIEKLFPVSAAADAASPSADNGSSANANDGSGTTPGFDDSLAVESTRVVPLPQQQEQQQPQQQQPQQQQPQQQQESEADINNLGFLNQNRDHFVKRGLKSAAAAAPAAAAPESGSIEAQSSTEAPAPAPAASTAASTAASIASVAAAPAAAGSENKASAAQPQAKDETLERLTKAFERANTKEKNFQETYNKTKRVDQGQWTLAKNEKKAAAKALDDYKQSKVKIKTQLIDQNRPPFRGGGTRRKRRAKHTKKHTKNAAKQTRRNKPFYFFN